MVLEQLDKVTREKLLDKFFMLQGLGDVDKFKIKYSANGWVSIRNPLYFADIRMSPALPVLIIGRDDTFRVIHRYSDMLKGIWETLKEVAEMDLPNEHYGFEPRYYNISIDVKSKYLYDGRTALLITLKGEGGNVWGGLVTILSILGENGDPSEIAVDYKGDAGWLVSRVKDDLFKLFAWALWYMDRLERKLEDIKKEKANS